MQVIKDEGARPIKAWVDTQYNGSSISGVPNIEDSALKQLKNLARLPFIHANGVAVMPDVHAGIGSTVGTVIATQGAIIPAAVGVDIGCGMIAVRLDLKADQLPDNLLDLRCAIEKAIPLGKGGEREQTAPMPNLKNRLSMMGQRHGTFRKGDTLDAMLKRATQQMGSLGSGNHFIEVCIDEEQRVWVMLHSGSRGIGNMIGTHFIEKAKRRMEQFYITLPDADLAYIPEDTDDFKDYMEAVQWAQEYALMNRKVMLKDVLAAIDTVMGVTVGISDEAISCFPGFTGVSATGVKEAQRRMYDGPIVTLKTASGKSLTVTPNHPILSEQGWAPAQSFNVGDNLISAFSCDRLREGINPDIQGVPTTFSELFDAFSVLSPVERVVGSPVDFHGDVSANDCKVDVVRPNRVLSYGEHSAFLQECGEQGLLCPNLAESSAFCDRVLMEFSLRDCAASQGSVSRKGNSFSLLAGEALHPVGQSSTPTPGLDTCSVQEFKDTGSAYSCERGQGFDRGPFVVALDKIVDIVWGHWSGHVFNLSTESGWYLAEGIISHNCHHNYVERENHFGTNLWVTRKGAVQARKDSLGIIPGSMGQKSYIVRGKGNLESYCSCSHGAGRTMSRSAATKKFSLTDLIAQTEGVECRKDEGVIDEIPGAYKSLDLVMANQADLVEVVHTLKAILCVKGN